MYWSRLIAVALIMPSIVEAISYRCDGNRILIVQSFGNNTIRMHCQMLSICGNRNLKCNYAENQSHCGGKNSFVAHVEQDSPTEPVKHKCCDVTDENGAVDNSHYSNECFVYELPDGMSKSNFSLDSNVNATEIRTLSGENLLSENADSYDGYKLRLFLLKNKSKAKLLVKGIERRDNGYRVTICHPKCQVSTNEGNSGCGQGIKYLLSRKQADGDWFVAAWSAWSSSKMTHWNSLDALQNVRLRSGDIKMSSIPARALNGGSELGLHSLKNTFNAKIDPEGDSKNSLKQQISSNIYENAVNNSILNANGLKNSQNTGIVQSDGQRTAAVAADTSQKPFKSNDNDTKVAATVNRRINGHDSSSNEGKERVEVTTKDGKKFVSVSHENGKKLGDITVNIITNKDGNGGEVIAVTQIKKPNGISSLLTEAVSTSSTAHPVTATEGSNSEQDLKDSKTALTTGATPSSRSFLNNTLMATVASNNTGKSTAKVITTTASTAAATAQNHAEAGKADGNAKSLDVFDHNREDKVKKKSNRITSNDAKSSNSSGGKSKAGTRKVEKSGAKQNSKELMSPEALKLRKEIDGILEPLCNDNTTDWTVELGKICSNQSYRDNYWLLSYYCRVNEDGNTKTASNSICDNGLYRPRDVKNKTEEEHKWYDVAMLFCELGPYSGPPEIKKNCDDQRYDIMEKTISELCFVKSYVSINRVLQTYCEDVKPASSGGGSSPSGKQNARNCFSGDSTVMTPFGEILMRDLKIGDLVLVPAAQNVLKYETVEMFYHREPDTEAKFVVLHTESGKTLSLTELHLLPVGNCAELTKNLESFENIDEMLRASIFAYKAREGDCLLSVADNGELKSDKIVKIGRKYSRGIYAPITVEGSIITDGVLASCFSQLESHFLHKLAHDFYILLYYNFGSLMNSIYSPIQHLPVYIDTLHQVSRYVLPFAKY